MRLPGLILLLQAAFLLHGTVYDVYPGDDVEATAAGLAAGDEMIFHDGTYTVESIRLNGLQGSDTTRTVLQAADGEFPVIYGSTAENGINITNCRYLTIKGLEVRHTSEAIKFNASSTNTNVLLEDLTIHDTVAAGIAGSSGANRYITIRRCEVYDTGNGAATGTGIYMSYYGNDVQYLTVEYCLVHDTGGSGGNDCIGIKFGRDCIIRYNVCYNSDYPCIRVESADDTNRTNLIESNVCWGSNNSGIETYGDCIVRNNIVFDCHVGIYSRDDSKYPLRNVNIVNNTVYACGSYCLHVNDWGGKSGLTIANNAFYQDSGSAVAVYVYGGLDGVDVHNNIYYGSLYLNGASGSGFSAGGSPSADMVNPSTVPGSCDFYPTDASALIDAGGSGASSLDFNGNARDASPDVGAYEYTQSGNPGWQIDTTFRGEVIGTGVSASPTDMYFTADRSNYPGGSGSQNVSVHIATGTVNSVTCGAAWVTLSSLPTFPASGDFSFAVTVFAAGLSDGSYSTTILVDGSDGDDTVAVHFTVADNAGSADSDSDGMPDDWETGVFGDLSQDGTSDYDSDGASNLAEYQAGTNPVTPGGGKSKSTTSCMSAGRWQEKTTPTGLLAAMLIVVKLLKRKS